MSNTSPTPSEPFSASAASYDDLYGYQAAGPELATYQEHLGEPRPPRNRLVEFGCGTGRFSRSLQQLGWHVLGIEPCPQMSQIATQKGITVIRGTVQTAYAGPHDRIVAPFTVLGYAAVQGGLLRCLGRLRKTAARRGTILAFDLIDRDAAQTGLWPVRETTLLGGSTRTDHRVHDSNGHLLVTAEMRSPEGGYLWSERHRIATYAVPEVRTILEGTGWRPIYIGPRDGKTVEPHPWHMFYAAEAV